MTNVIEANGEWSGILRMLLTDMQVLVGQETPAGIRMRAWERYDCVRHGYKHVSTGGHVVRCDFEDGSSVLFQFADARQAPALADYLASG